MIYVLVRDGDVRRALVPALKDISAEYAEFSTLSALFAAERIEPCDLAVADASAGVDADCMLRTLRGRHSTKWLPIAFIASNSTEYTRAAALDYGADDFIALPMARVEIGARLRALVRRGSAVAVGNRKRQYVARGFVFLPDEHSLLCNGAEVCLPQKELQLLSLLAENEGTPLGRDLLMRALWGYEYDGSGRTVDVHVNSLRRKLAATGARIITVRGIGYKLQLEAV